MKKQMLLAVILLLPAIANADTGYTVASQDETLFVTVRDGLVYGEKCSTDENAPKSFKDCFGARTWPDARTPFATKNVFASAMNRAKKRSSEFHKNIESLNAVLVELDKKYKEKVASHNLSVAGLKKDGKHLVFLESRLKEDKVPAEAKTAIQAEIVTLKEFIHTLETNLKNSQDELNNLISTANTVRREKDENSAANRKDSDYNSYLESETTNLFGTQSVNNISISEPFGGVLFDLFTNPRVTLEWEGSEVNSYSPSSTASVYRRIFLKKITLNSAFAPGQLTIATNGGVWEKAIGPISTAITPDLLKADGVLEGDAIPAKLREPLGNFEIPFKAFETQQTVNQYAFLMGSDSLRLVNVMYLGLNTFKTVGDSLAFKMEDQRATATLPMKELPLSLARVTYDSGAGVKSVLDENRYNGNAGVRACLKNVEVLAAIDSFSCAIPHGKYLNASYRYTDNFLELRLEKNIDNTCVYKGQRNVSRTRAEPFVLDGVEFTLH